MWIVYQFPDPVVQLVSVFSFTLALFEALSSLLFRALSHSPLPLHLTSTSLLLSVFPPRKGARPLPRFAAGQRRVQEPRGGVQVQRRRP